MIYGNSRKTFLLPMAAGYNSGYNTIIPGSSTVAMFMTTIGNLRDSSPSRTERLVNAFIMSHLRSHPSASPWRPGVGSRHGHLQATVSLTFHRTNSTFLAVPRAKLANNFKMDLFFFKIFHLFSTSPSGLGNITPCSGHPKKQY